jgi:hypothetical protein
MQGSAASTSLTYSLGLKVTKTKSHVSVEATRVGLAANGIWATLYRSQQVMLNNVPTEAQIKSVYFL